jgi:S1-C subfamily serine protease
MMFTELAGHNKHNLKLNLLQRIVTLLGCFILFSCSAELSDGVSQAQWQNVPKAYSDDLFKDEEPINQVAKNGQRVFSDEENTVPYIPSEILLQIESVVCLESIISDKSIQFTGFIVDTGGLILSTAHDLKGLQELNVTLYDGRKSMGRVIKADHHLDLALIQVDLKSPSYISLEKGRNLLGMGERLYTTGCPVNLRGTVFSGLINGPPRRIDNLVYWQVSMKIYPGSSGSPVFDGQGNLVAVIKGRFRGMDSLGFLIPFETIVDFVKGINYE